MRIVALAHYYIEANRGGGEIMLHNILKELAKYHNVTAFITNNQQCQNTVIDNVNINYGGYDELVTQDFDIIISHLNHAELARRLAIQRGSAFIYLNHNDRLESLQIASKMNRQKELILYNSYWLRRKTNRQGIVLHPPINKEQGKPINNEYITLINLIEAKGAKEFYKLAEMLPQYKFLGVKGGYYKTDQIIVSKPNITIIENTPNMKKDVYMKSKIILMLSNYETYGMVASEAIRYGLPVIATPCDGLIENLGGAGIFINHNDIDNIKREIVNLMQDDYYYSMRSEIALYRARQQETDNNMQELVKWCNQWR